MKRSLACFVLVLSVLGAAPAHADLSLMTRPGSWCDVVPFPPSGGFAFLRADGATVIAEVDGVERWRVQLQEPTLYLDAAAATAGSLFVVMQGNDSGRALAVLDGRVFDLGVSFGQNATAAWFDGNRFIAFVQRSPTSADRVFFTAFNTLERTEAFALPATSQGFRDITPDGEVRLGDAFFQRTIRNYSLHEPVERGSTWAGQWSAGPDGAGVVFTDRELAFTAIAGVVFEPRLARQGDRVAIAGRTPRGAVLAIASPPYPANEPLELHAGGSEPPTPRTDPPPPAQRMPDRRAVLDELRRGYGGELTHAQAGEVMARLAFRLKAEGFGLIRKDGGNNCPVPNSSVRVSCDIILHRPSSTWCDVLVSGPDTLEDGSLKPGPSTATWCAGNPGEMAGFFVPPDPGGATVPPPVDVPPPASPTFESRLAAAEAAVADLKTRLAASEAQVVALERRVGMLESRPLPDLTAAIDAALANLQVVGKTRVAFGHQHAIDLSVSRRHP